MDPKLKAKIKESLGAVLPITGIVLLLGFTVVPLDIGTAGLFLIGSAFLVICMGIILSFPVEQVMGLTEF